MATGRPSFMDLTFFVQTFGCQMNKHDSERVVGMLESLGALQVESIEEADVVVFMTCCVREAADIRLIGQVNTMKNVPLRKGSPLSKRIIAVGGCIGQRDGEGRQRDKPERPVSPDRVPAPPCGFPGVILHRGFQLVDFIFKLRLRNQADPALFLIFRMFLFPAHLIPSPSDVCCDNSSFCPAGHT